MRLIDGVALAGSGDARLSDRYDCNAYAVRVTEGCVLVDTGAGRSTDAVLDRAERTVGPVRGVLLTHAHADHSQGGPNCQERGIEVVASERTATLLGDGTDHELGVDAARADGVYPSDYRFTNYRPDRHVAPPTTVSVAGRSFEVVPSPGHATDHVAYITEVDGTRCCFVGDAIAPDGRVNLLNVPGSSLAAYREHIDRLVGRGIDALLPGHGMPMLADGQEAIETVADALKGMSPPPSRT